MNDRKIVIRHAGDRNSKKEKDTREREREERKEMNVFGEWEKQKVMH